VDCLVRDADERHYALLAAELVTYIRPVTMAMKRSHRLYHELLWPRIVHTENGRELKKPRGVAIASLRRSQLEASPGEAAPECGFRKSALRPHNHSALLPAPPGEPAQRFYYSFRKR
jgi:hypothetical protein